MIIPFAFAQDSSASIIPWESLKLHVKWSNRVETLVKTGELVINTRNVIIDSSHYDKTKGLNAYEVMEKYNESKQLIVQTHEQSQSDSASTFLEMRGPCKDMWFGLKANADFSAHTSDVVTDTLYSPSVACPSQPHQSLGVVRLSSIALGQTITSATMKVNDEQLFAEQQSGFFNQVIPYYRYTGCPAPGYYYYSFALYPQSYAPSGAFNFSRAGDKYLNITYNPYLSTIHVISNRYNVTDKNNPIFVD